MIMIEDMMIQTIDILKITLDGIGKTLQDALLDYYVTDTERYEKIKKLFEEKRPIHLFCKNIEEVNYVFNFLESTIVSGYPIKLRTYNIPIKQIIESLNNYSLETTMNLFIKSNKEDKAFTDYNILKVYIEKLENIKMIIKPEASQLEIIKACYDEVKNKNNNIQENVNNLSKGKSLTFKFLSNYNICQNDIKIFNMLLKEYDIKCSEYKLKRYDSPSHFMSMVNINDKKYNVNGIYFFDPTKDSYTDNLGNTNYKYFLQTFNDLKYKHIIEDSFNLLLKNKNLTELADNIEKSLLIGQLDLNISSKSKNFYSEIINIYHNLLSKVNIYYSNDSTKQLINTYRIINLIVNNLGEEIDKDTFISLLASDSKDITYILNSYISKYENVDYYHLDKILKKRS